MMMITLMMLMMITLMIKITLMMMVTLRMMITTMKIVMLMMMMITLMMIIKKITEIILPTITEHRPKKLKREQRAMVHRTAHMILDLTTADTPLDSTKQLLW